MLEADQREVPFGVKHSHAGIESRFESFLLGFKGELVGEHRLMKRVDTCQIAVDSQVRGAGLTSDESPLFGQFLTGATELVFGFPNAGIDIATLIERDIEL